MKIVRGLLYFTAGFFLFLCILVAVCAFRPDLSERIAEFLYPERDQAVTAETDGEPPETEAAVGADKGSEKEESPDRRQSDAEDAEDAGGAEEPPGMEKRIASDYIVPDQSEIAAPEKVSGRNGYQQIEGQQEQVDETAAREIENRADMGYTGDDLEFDGLYYPYYAMLNEKGRQMCGDRPEIQPHRTGSGELGAEMNQSAYSALVNGQTVCAGYARTFQYLMQQLGIPCYYCTGYAGESHAWNIIRLDDGYYNVDTTWDDTGDGTYNYFNKMDADYADSHMRQEMSVYLPSCDGQAYRGLETEDESLRSLEDIGMTENQVIADMQGYYADCLAQILQNGRGSYTFYNVIEGEGLLEEWYRDYQTEHYRQAYMRDAMEETGLLPAR